MLLTLFFPLRLITDFLAMMRDDQNSLYTQSLTLIHSKKFHVPLLLCCNLILISSFFPFVIAVINELEGLSRGIKLLASAGIVVAQQSSQTTSSHHGNRNDPKHAAFVAKASKEALVFLKSKNPATK